MDKKPPQVDVNQDEADTMVQETYHQFPSLERLNPLIG
jgi:hypothetical protein